MKNKINEIVSSGKLVYIKQPNIDELNYVSELWTDEETMRDVGGTIAFPEEKRGNWYRRMVQPGDGKNFYCLIYNHENNPVGEVSFHGYDREEKSANFNIKVQYKYRGNGYAKEAMELMLNYYFYEFGGEVIFDDVINVNGQRALSKFGFEIVSEFEDEVSFEMTKDRFTQLMKGDNNV